MREDSPPWSDGRSGSSMRDRQVVRRAEEKRMGCAVDGVVWPTGAAGQTGLARTWKIKEAERTAFGLASFG